MVAIQILGETAKTNLAATKVLHRLAQGLKTTEDLLTPPLSSRSGRSGEVLFHFRKDMDNFLEVSISLVRDGTEGGIPGVYF